MIVLDGFISTLFPMRLLCVSFRRLAFGFLLPASLFLLLQSGLFGQPAALSTATLLGGSGDHDSVEAVALRADGRVVVAANLSDAAPQTGSTEWRHVSGTDMLAGAGSSGWGGAVLLLSASGQEVEAVIWVGAEVRDLALDDTDRVHVALGADGVLALSADLTAVRYRALAELADLGDLDAVPNLSAADIERVYVERLDADGAGHVAALLPVKLQYLNRSNNLGHVAIAVLRPDGSLRSLFAGNSQHTNDVALSEGHGQVAYLGYRVTSAVVNSIWEGGPVWSYPVHIPYIAARDLDGELLWLGYNWESHPWLDDARTLPNPRFLNFPFRPAAYNGELWEFYANNMADTRGYRIAYGRDGKLYGAYESAGGNTPLIWSPYDLTDAVRMVGGDPWFNFNNSASEHKTVFLRYDPAGGKPLLGQYFTTRYRNPSTGALQGNSAFVQRGGIAADEQGNVYLGGESASGLPFWPSPGYFPRPGEAAFNPQAADVYTGGAWFMAVSADFTRRLYLTRLASDSATHGVAARTLSGESAPRVVWGGRQTLQKPGGEAVPTFQYEPFQEAPGGGERDGFLALLGPAGMPLDPLPVRTDLSFGPQTLKANQLLRGGALENTQTDVNGDGTLDTVGRHSFSLSQPLAATTADYLGVPIYGGVELITLGASDHAAALRLDTTFQSLFATGVGGHPQRFAGLFAVKREDFAHTGTSGPATLAPGTRFWLDCPQFGSDLEARWAVRLEGAGWFLSEATWNPSNPSFELAADSRWAPYNPETALYFEEGTPFSVIALDAVEAVGVYIGGGRLDGTDSQTGLRLRRFVVQAPAESDLPAPSVRVDVGGAYSPVAVPGTPVNFASEVADLPAGWTASWDFGDGQSATGWSASHAYASPGTYRVWLTLENASGAIVTRARDIVVRNDAFVQDFPKAIIDTSVEKGDLPLEVAFAATRSTSYNGALSYAWNFGDGTTATGPTATHTFSEADTFQVRLTVTDSLGRTDSEYAHIRAEVPRPSHPRLLFDADHLETVRSKVADPVSPQRTIFEQMREAAKRERDGSESWYSSFNIIDPSLGAPALLPGETSEDIPLLYLDGQPSPALVAALAALSPDPAEQAYYKDKALELVFLLIKPRSNGTGPQSDLYYAPGTPESEKWQPADDPLGLYDAIHAQINPLTGRPYLGRSDISLERYGQRFARQWALTNSALFRGTEMKAVALAYDLCFNLWLEDDLANGTDNVGIISRALVQQADSLRTTGGSGWPGNDAYGSNWYIIRYGMAGLGYLVADTEYDPAHLNFVHQRVRQYADANMSRREDSMGWNVEGYGYAGFSMPFAHAYMLAARRADPANNLYAEFPGMRLQPASLFRGVLPIPASQSAGMSSVYPENLRLGVRPDFSDDGQFTWELSGLEGLAFHPELTPEGWVPGLRWLFDRLSGDLGDRTYGYGYTRSFYAAFFYRDDVPAQNPEDVWGLHFYDPTFGLFLMRNQYSGDNGLNGTPHNEDIVFGTTANMRLAQGGHSGADQHGLRLWGLGLPWAVGSGRTNQAGGQSTLFALAPESSVHRFAPGTVDDYYLRSAGGGYTVTSTGLLSAVGTERHTRRTVLSFDEGLTGAAAVAVVADTSNNGRYWRLNTPGMNAIEVLGTDRFRISLDPATVAANPHFPQALRDAPPAIYGRILTPSAGQLTTGTFARQAQFENARIYGQDFPVNRWVQWESTGGATDFVVVLSLVPHGAVEPDVQWASAGEGIQGVVTVGSQTFDFTGDAPAVSGWERPAIHFADNMPDYFLEADDFLLSGTVASLPGRMIDRIDIEVEGSVVGQAQISPADPTAWSFHWVGAPLGAHAVRARAIDSAGEWGQTAERIVSVTVSLPPSVALLTPGHGSVLPFGGALHLSGTATDADGQIDRVDLFLNGALAGRAVHNATTGRWHGTLTVARPNTYRVEAVAVDNAGDTARTGEVHVRLSERFSDDPAHGDLADFSYNTPAFPDRDPAFVRLEEVDGRRVMLIDTNEAAGFREGVVLRGPQAAGDVRLSFRAKANFDIARYSQEYYDVAIGSTVWVRLAPSLSDFTGTSLMLANSGDGQVWQAARGVGIPSTDWHDIEIERINDNIRVFVDGRMILNFSEPRLADPGRARITLPWRNDNISMFFEDISLEFLDGDEARAARPVIRAPISQSRASLGAATVISGTIQPGADPVERVVLYAGSTELGEATLEGDTWSFTWTPTITGTQALGALAVDARNRHGWADPVVVRVAEGSGTAAVEPPVVTIFEPFGDTVVAPGATLVVRGRATGAIGNPLEALWMETAAGVARRIPVDANGFWSQAFDTSRPGPIVRSFRARAANGLETVIDSCTVIVAESAPETPVRINFGPGAAAYNGWHTVGGGTSRYLFPGVAAGFDSASGHDGQSAANALAPDARYESFVRMGSRPFRLHVPNGLYRVRVVAGDPASPDTTGTQRLEVQGVVVINEGISSSAPWRSHTADAVLVADGVLTLRDLSGHTALCWLEVERIPGQAAPPEVALLAPEAVNVTSWGTGVPLELRAAVSDGDAPAASVEFLVGGVSVGSAPVVEGAAHLSWTPSSAGIREIRARAADTDGLSWTSEAGIVEVIDGYLPPPHVAFTADVISGGVPLAVAFDASATVCPAGTPLRLDWNFGNGLVNRNPNGTPWYDHQQNLIPGTDTVHPTMLFRSAGTFTVTLTARNAQGATSTAEMQIVVSGGEVIIDDYNREHIRYKGRWDYWYTQNRQEGPFLYESISDNYKKETFKGTKEIWIEPRLPGAGLYNLYEWSPRTGSTVVNLTVHHASEPAAGSAPAQSVVAYSQRDSDGQWQHLGAFHFDPADHPHLWLPNAGTNGNLYADAFRWSASGPLANAVFTVSEGGAPATVAFADAGSVPSASGNTLTYAWDFGDGASAVGPSASHTYAEPGIYHATLTVSDGGGTAQTRLTVDVPPASAPEALIEGPRRLGALQTAAYSTPDAPAGSAITWDFGDGSTASGAAVTHAWSAPGVYRLRLEVSAPSGATGIREALVEVMSGPANTAPVANISMDTTSGFAPLTVRASAADSLDSDGAVTGVYWDFGDGATASGIEAAHTYTEPGSYILTLTVVDNGGLTATATRSITVSEFGSNRAPVAVLSAQPTVGIVPLTVSFSGAASYDPDGDPLTFAWTGPGIAHNDSAFEHTFTEVGQHVVALTVSDGELQDTVNLTIVVQPETNLPMVSLWVLEEEAIRSTDQKARMEFIREASDTSTALTVRYGTAAGTLAQHGADFSVDGVFGEFTFAPHETSRVIEFTPLPVDPPAGPLPLNIEILPEDYYLAAAQAPAALLVRDTDLSVDAGAWQTVAASTPGGEGSFTLEGSASEPGRIDSWEWHRADTGDLLGTGSVLNAALPVGGPYIIRLTGTSLYYAESVSAETRVTVVDFGQLPPVADPGPDLTVIAADGRYAAVPLDGRASYDPDGDVVAWTWLRGGQSIAAGETATAHLHVGGHALVLEVMDDDGNRHEASFHVEVVDGLLDEFYIDFGANTAASPHWNHVRQLHTGGIFDNTPRTDPIPLVSPHGTRAAELREVSFNTSRVFEGQTTFTVTEPAAGWVDADVAHDLLFYYHETAGEVQLGFVIAGLGEEKRYRVELFPTRYNANWDFVAYRWNNLPASAGGSDSTSLRFNSGTVWTWTNLLADQGRLVFNATPADGSTQRIPINALRILEEKTYPAQRRTLALSANEPAAVRLNGGGRVFSGDEVTVTVEVLDSNFVFTGWSDGDSAASRTLTVAEDIHLEAILEPAGTLPSLYTLTVFDGSGSGQYAEGAVVAIAADAPTAGEAFSGWGGDVAHVSDVTSATTEVLMPAHAVTVWALYEPVPVFGYSLESESLSRRSSAGSSATVVSDAAASGGARVQVTGAGGQGQWVEFDFSGVEPGVYALTYRYWTWDNRALVQAAHEGVDAGSPFDQNGPRDDLAEFRQSHAVEITIPSTSLQTLRFTAVDKTAASNGYSMSFDRFDLERIGDLPLEGYESWIEARWPGVTDSELTAPETDASGNGFANLAEYALGMDPLNPAAFQRPVFTSLPLSDGWLRLSLTFERIEDPAILYEVQASRDLAAGGWTTVWFSTGPGNLPGPIEVSHDTDSADGSSFLRLRISR